MADRRRQLPLTEESRTVFGAPQRVAQDLQRQASSGLELLGLVDLAHPAAAEQPDDPIRPPDLPVHEAGCARPRWIARGRDASRGRVAGPGERFRPGGQQARRTQPFGRIRRQLPSAPRTTTRQVGHRFGHHIPRFVSGQIWPFIWIRQNRRPGLRTQRLNEMTDLVVDVPSIGNRFRDALA